MDTQHTESVSLPTENHLGLNDGEKKTRYVAVTETNQEVEVPPPTSESEKSHQPRQSSPPPRVQDVLPSEDEIKEGRERELDDTLHEHPEEEEELDEEENEGHQGGGVGTLGLENVDIKSRGGYDPTHPDYIQHVEPSYHAPQSRQTHQVSPSEQPHHAEHPQKQTPPGQSGAHRRERDTEVLGFDRSRFGGT